MGPVQVNDENQNETSEVDFIPRKRLELLIHNIFYQKASFPSFPGEEQRNLSPPRTSWGPPRSENTQLERFTSPTAAKENTFPKRLGEQGSNLWTAEGARGPSLWSRWELVVPFPSSSRASSFCLVMRLPSPWVKKRRGTITKETLIVITLPPLSHGIDQDAKKGLRDHTNQPWVKGFFRSITAQWSYQTVWSSWCTIGFFHVDGEAWDKSTPSISADSVRNYERGELLNFTVSSSLIQTTLGIGAWCFPITQQDSTLEARNCVAASG